jgi:uncharacterized small protein (DUF1192 family)
MALFDDLPPQKKVTHEMGQDLAALSVHELDERIGLLRAEIERLEAAKAGKMASKSAADAFFSRKG